MTIGVLALQGCINPHLKMCEAIGVPAVKVREKADFAKIDRLILPGGESTTMLSLLLKNKLEAPLLEFAREHPVWGVCAGAILIAKEVTHPTQRSFGLIDIRAVRNFYGSQLDSFKTLLTIKKLGIETAVDFIRAPKLEPLNESVEVLAVHDGAPVLLRQGKVLAGSFHVELGEDTRLHRFFAGM